MKKSILLLSPGVMERQDMLEQEVARKRGSKEPSSYMSFLGHLVFTLSIHVSWSGLKGNWSFLSSPLRKNLCPALIVILGNPIHDKTITSAHSSSTSTSIESDSVSPGVSDHGRGSGCSSTAPALSGPVARTIYYIAAELVRLVGSVDSMKPVLQSLYHRVLLYPPPQHRVEAIKIMKEVGRPWRTPPALLWGLSTLCTGST